MRTLEDLLLSKGRFQYEISLRKAELNIRKVNQTPEIKVANTSSQVENQVIKEITDPYISNRELWLKSIERLELMLDDKLLEVYKCKFINYKYLAWVDIGEHLGYAKSSIYRMRYKILQEFNNLIGMF